MWITGLSQSAPQAPGGIRLIQAPAQNLCAGAWHPALTQHPAKNETCTQANVNSGQCRSLRQRAHCPASQLSPGTRWVLAYPGGGRAKTRGCGEASSGFATGLTTGLALAPAKGLCNGRYRPKQSPALFGVGPSTGSAWGPRRRGFAGPFPPLAKPHPALAPARGSAPTVSGWLAEPRSPGVGPSFGFSLGPVPTGVKGEAVRYEAPAGLGSPFVRLATPGRQAGEL